MSLVYRSTIGRRLTVSEGDGNISELSGAAGITFLPSGTGGVSRTVSSALAAMVRSGDYNSLANAYGAAASLTEGICGASFHSASTSNPITPNAGTTSLQFRAASTMQAGSNGSYQMHYYAAGSFQRNGFTGLQIFGLLVDCSNTWAATGAGTISQAYGVYIDQPFNASISSTNSAALSIGVNPGGDWAIYSASTKNSKLSGDLSVTGLTVATSGATISGNVNITGSIFASTTIQAADGLANAPSITFNNQGTVGIYRAGGNTLGIATNGVVAATFNSSQALTVVGAFGCNAATAQTAAASGGALAAYAAGANGLDTGAHMSSLHALVVAIRAALVANGIMS